MRPLFRTTVRDTASPTDSAMLMDVLPQWVLQVGKQTHQFKLIDIFKGRSVKLLPEIQQNSIFPPTASIIHTKIPSQKVSTTNFSFSKTSNFQGSITRHWNVTMPESDGACLGENPLSARNIGKFGWRWRTAQCLFARAIATKHWGEDWAVLQWSKIGSGNGFANNKASHLEAGKQRMEKSLKLK